MTIRELEAQQTEISPELAEARKDPAIAKLFDLVGDLDDSNLPHIIELCESVLAEKSH